MLTSKQFREYHIFVGKDHLDQLIKITELLGTDMFFDYIKKYGIKLEKNEIKRIKQYSDVLISSKDLEVKEEGLKV